MEKGHLVPLSEYWATSNSYRLLMDARETTRKVFYAKRDRDLYLVLTSCKWYRRLRGGVWYLVRYRFDMHMFTAWERKYEPSNIFGLRQNIEAEIWV